MSSLLQLLKDMDSRLVELPQPTNCGELFLTDQISYLTGREVIRGYIAGEIVLISRRKLREIIDALESK